MIMEIPMSNFCIQVIKKLLSMMQKIFCLYFKIFHFLEND